MERRIRPLVPATAKMTASVYDQRAGLLEVSD